MAGRRSPTSTVVEFLGSSRDDLSSFPLEVRREIGQAIYEAELGGKHPSAKPLKGDSLKGVLEIVSDFDTNTYRAVYTVRFKNVLYVLDAFQKKSPSGIGTARHDIVRIKTRLAAARDHFEKNYMPRSAGRAAR